MSVEFVAQIIERVGLGGADRVLDLGTGPGRIALRLAPYVSEVVGVDIEPDMAAEANRRARVAGVTNASFIVGAAEELQELAPNLGKFRAVTMGETFHWMRDRDRVLSDLAAITDEGAAVLLIRTGVTLSGDERLTEAREIVTHLLEEHFVEPPGPHPRGRHDPFPEILARSAFSQVEEIEYQYQAEMDLDADILVGRAYAESHVMRRLGDRRPAFEEAVRKALSGITNGTPAVEFRSDSAHIGQKP